MDKRTKKTLSDQTLLLRVRKYCALRERSIKEVKKKLFELEIMEDRAEIIVEKLKQEGFLNEKRYVTAFARGKFRNKKWGKRKIEIELKKQGVTGDLLEEGLNELENENYVEVLDNLLQKKWRQIKTQDKGNNYADDNLFTPAMQKLINYATQKGFEYDLIVERVKKLL